MSSSDVDSVEAESSNTVKSNPPKESVASSESTNESESEDESDNVTKEKAIKPKTKKAPLNSIKNKSYEKMVYEAMVKLNENRRLGVSIQRIMKHVQETNDLPSNRVKFFCKKAIDKGLKTDIYVHTSGAGLTGSIVFAASYWNDKKKALKAKEKKENQKTKAAAKQKSKLKPKAKAMVEPKTKATNKPKVESKIKKSQPQKDKNNNSTATKTIISKKTKRLSVVVSTVMGKPKMKMSSGSKASKMKKSEAVEKTVKPGPSANEKTKNRR